MNNGKQANLLNHDLKTIVSKLNQTLHVGLSADNIQNPTSEIALSVFMNFVRLFMNVADHSLTTLPLSATSEFDPELHKRSVQQTIIYQSMKAFLADNSGKQLDLAMCDLVTPAKKQGRFKKILSFLVDFIKLHEMASPGFNEISEEFSEQKHEQEMLQEEIAAAEKKKHELLSRQNLRKRRENELMDEHSKVKNELNGVVNQYTDILAMTENINKQEADLRLQIVDLDRETMTATKTIEHLTEEVLESPEQLRNEMSERKKQIEELKDCLTVSSGTLKEKKEARDICANSEKNLPVMHQRIQCWKEIREDILDLIDEMEEKDRKLAEMQEQLTFTTDKKNTSEKRMIEQAEMHEQLRKEHLQRCEKLNKNIEDILGQITALGKNQPDVSRDIEIKRRELIAAKNAHSERLSRIMNSAKDSFAEFHKIDAHFKETKRVADEKRCAMDRAKSRLCNSFKSRLPSDYTFSASSINETLENCDPQSDVFEDFSVFKN